MRLMNIAAIQIEAYNSRNLEKFLECYTDDVQVYMLQNNQLLTDGLEKLSEVMKADFEKNPNANSTITSYISQGNLIVQHEEITGHMKDKTISSVSIYEITDGKISKLWFGGRTIE